MAGLAAKGALEHWQSRNRHAGAAVRRLMRNGAGAVPDWAKRLSSLGPEDGKRRPRAVNAEVAIVVVYGVELGGSDGLIARRGLDV